MLTVGYGNSSEFRTHIKTHLSPPVPKDWPNAHFPEVIHVQISFNILTEILHMFYKIDLGDIQLDVLSDTTLLK
jgi:hypothetical protein